MMLTLSSLQFNDVHGCVENRIDEKMGSFTLHPRFGFDDLNDVEAVYNNAVSNLISDKYLHAVPLPGDVSSHLPILACFI